MEHGHVKPQLIFWTYLFQIAIVSLLLFIWSVLVALDVIPNKMGTAFSRDPWLKIALPLGSALLALVSVDAIIQYREGKSNWVYWTIAAGIVHTALFTWFAYRTIVVFSPITFYSILMVCVNLLYIVHLFKLGQRGRSA